MISHPCKPVFPKPKNPSSTKLGVTQSGSNTATRNSEAAGSRLVTDCSGSGLLDQQSLPSQNRRSRMPSKLSLAETGHLGKRSVSFEDKPQAKRRVAKGTYHHSTRRLIIKIHISLLY